MTPLFFYLLELFCLLLRKAVHKTAGLHLKPASAAIGVQPPPVGRASLKGFGRRPAALCCEFGADSRCILPHVK